MKTNFQCEIASNYKRQPIIKYLKSIKSTWSMVHTQIQYENIIIIIVVVSAPASTRPDPRGRGQNPRGRGRGQDPRGQGRGHTILAFEIQQILKAIKKNFIEI